MGLVEGQYRLAARFSQNTGHAEMGAWNAWQSLDLECVARDEGSILGVKGDVVAMNGVIGELGIEVIGEAKGAGRVEIVDSDGACMTRNLSI